MCRLEHGPDEFLLEMTGLRLGDVAFVGIPGEPFTEIGVRIKDTDGWKMILPCCLVNGSQGYFPSREAFSEGGYEARSSNFRPDVADLIVEGGKLTLFAICALRLDPTSHALATFADVALWDQEVSVGLVKAFGGAVLLLPRKIVARGILTDPE